MSKSIEVPGFGSIREKNSAWQLRWTDSRKGRRQATFHGTEDEAKIEIARLKALGDKPKSRVTWADYWEDVVEPSFKGLEAKTIHNYMNEWKRYLCPRVSAWRVSETTWRMTQDMIDTIPTRSTQEHAHRLFRKMCRMAMRDGLLDANPTEAIRFRKKVRKQKVLYRADEMPVVMESIRGLRYEVPILLMLGAGLRVSEAFAMRWDHMLDYDGMIAMKVSDARVVVGGDVVEKGTKTQMSERLVMVGEPFASRIRELREASPIDKCCAMRPDNASSKWRTFAISREIKYVCFENMRSVFATLCGEAEVNGSLVSMFMGHTDGTTRGDNYQSSTILGTARVARRYSEFLEEEKRATDGPQNSVEMCRFLSEYEKIGQRQ